MLSIIVAVSENGVIGKDNQLLWKLSADLKQFKTLTTNHIVIMGRKTFESIGRPLPNRISIVITSQSDYFSNKSEMVHCYTASSLEKAVEMAKLLKPMTANNSDEVFIIGGGEVYQQALKITDKVYLTEVRTSLEGDTFFPPLNMAEWREIRRNFYQADEKNEYDFDFVELVKILPPL